MAKTDMGNNNTDTHPIYRFAPSPNGFLHLGHAYSALLNQRMAAETGGRLLLRIEDIDRERCLPELEEAMLEDLHWLGIEWEEPVRRQSEHFEVYGDVVDTLREAGLAYPSFMSRAEIRREIAASEEQGKAWPRDPDGAPHMPPLDRGRNDRERETLMASGAPWSMRLDMAQAVKYVGRQLYWEETGSGPKGETGKVTARPSDWGDIIISRKDTPTSYHIACIVDDSLQGVTHVVRGRDLFFATAVQRLLQEILGLASPLYHHHDLILADDGRKLSKSNRDTSIRELRKAGLKPADIIRMTGLEA